MPTLPATYTENTARKVQAKVHRHGMAEHFAVVESVKRHGQRIYAKVTECGTIEAAHAYADYYRTQPSENF